MRSEDSVAAPVVEKMDNDEDSGIDLSLDAIYEASDSELDRAVYIRQRAVNEVEIFIDDTIRAVRGVFGVDSARNSWHVLSSSVNDRKSGIGSWLVSRRLDGESTDTTQFLQRIGVSWELLIGTDFMNGFAVSDDIELNPFRILEKIEVLFGNDVYDFQQSLQIVRPRYKCIRVAVRHLLHNRIIQGTWINDY